MKDRDTIYIHYGNNEFNPDLVTLQKKSTLLSKPDKGLWASRYDDKDLYTWRKWCKDADYEDISDDMPSFKFILSKSANILRIYNEDSILPYVIPNSEFGRPLYMNCKTNICDILDRERLYSDYDGIELFISNNYPQLHNGIFNSWDCDSICVWNPDKIIVLNGV